MNKINTLGTIAGTALLGVLKSMKDGSLSQSPSEAERPDCSGMTGERAYDIFETNMPKIWFDLNIDPSLYHPKTKSKNIKKVMDAAKGQSEMVNDIIKSGTSVHEIILDVSSGRDQSLRKIYSYLTRTKGMSEERASKRLNGIASSVAALISRPSERNMLTSVQDWIKHGKNVATIGPNMQVLFEHTSLKGVSIEDIQMPYESIYIALPGFDGYIHDSNSKFHCLRGVYIYKIDKSLYGSEMSYGISVWGKPKYRSGETLNLEGREIEIPGGYDDLFLFAGIPNLKSDDLGKYIEDTFKSKDFTSNYSQPAECVDAVIRAVRIAFNLIMYWSTVNKNMELVHPELREKLAKIRAIEADARLRRKGKKGVQLRKKLDKLKKEYNDSNRFFWIERSDAYFTDDKRKKSEPDPNREKRKSPRAHIVSGHWRIINRGTENERTIWIESFFKGKGDAPPRFWKSRISKLK